MTPTVLWGSMGADSHSIDTGLETAVGKRQSLVHLATPWASGLKADGSPNYTAFPTAMLKPVYDRASLVLLDWASWRSDRMNALDPVFSLDSIIAGQHDVYANAWATLAAATGWTILLRFNWEMNGNWAVVANWGGQPEKYVAAWRRLHDIFVARGATNVKWVWCPNGVAPRGTRYTTAADKLPGYYPGDAYVDWLGCDLYNGNGGAPFVSVAQLFNGGAGGFGPTYDTLVQLAPGKPIALCEWGCWDGPGDKALWLAQALAALPRLFPQIRAMCYFNWGDRWPLSMPSGALAAFAGGIASPVYLEPGAQLDSLGVPTMQVGVSPPVPDQLQARGATWDAVALSLATDLAVAQAQTQALQQQIADAQAQLSDARAELTDAQAQLANGQRAIQTLLRFAGGQAASSQTDARSA